MDAFEQLQLLGRGGYASVHLVRRGESSDLFALKRIPRSKIASDQQKMRLEAEKQILQQVSSPFLCRGFETFETEGEEVGLLQEYVDGRALYECVWKYRDTGKFPEHVAKFFAAQLVLALRDLHARGFIHRDLKSGNILVQNDGFAKVIDFGLAKKVPLDDRSRADGNTSDRTQSVCGTHYVMAPEMFFRQSYGTTVDWWSLGVVIYEMVTGHPPWEYQCPASTTITEYFRQIMHSAEAPFCITTGNARGKADSLSAEIQGFVSGLLKINPHERIGSKGATEAMQHPWFRDIDWELFFTKDTSIAVPYDTQADYNTARVQTRPPADESLSSAESIDPEDNAKYFADF